MELNKKEYGKYVKDVTPKASVWSNMLRAFLLGGVICLFGQTCTDYFKNQGVEKELAASYTTLILVAVSILLSGMNLYQKLVKWGGAGALVPITGFANSVVSPAIEYKAEGQVFGIGVKIFTIAGPVILYGVFSSWVLGLIYWIGKTMKIF